MRLIFPMYSSQTLLVGDPHLCSSLSPQDTCSPLISSLSHSSFFFPLKYDVGSFGQELFDPGTTFTLEYIAARGRGADPSFLGCLESIIRLARLQQLKMN